MNEDIDIDADIKTHDSVSIYIFI